MFTNHDKRVVEVVEDGMHNAVKTSTSLLEV